MEMEWPSWIISLDLSKAFDRVNWKLLWQAVGNHGVSEHLVSNYQQRGTIVGSTEKKKTSTLTLQLACGKGVFSAHVCFVRSLAGHCPSGGHNFMVLATMYRLEGLRNWICALLIIPLYLQNRIRKSVMY